MSAGPATRITDVVVPEIFTPYIQTFTEQKARLIQSGLVARDPILDALLAGGGLTFNVPSWDDLDDDADRVSTDTSSVFASADASIPAGQARDPDPLKITTQQEIAVRLNRNNSWSSVDLATQLAGADPMDAIGSRVGYYWIRKLQAIFIATWNGVIADNTANDSGDYTNDVSGGSFVDGVTNFTPEAFIDTTLTLGDSMESVTAMMVHSTVYGRMQKLNLIDFIPDARGEISIPTYLGREVLVDDGVPRSGTIYDTWLFGPGATRLGASPAKVPTEIERRPGAGNGSGQDVLHSRQQWVMHPTGHAFVGTAPNGGPSNTGTAGDDLDEAASWNRVYPERKQIRFARMVTREA